jgi:hypothetical protein
VFQVRKAPPDVLPLNPELKIRSKPATKPEKSDAILRHQTRMMKGRHREDMSDS